MALVAIPHDWSVIGLLGDMVHLPNAILPRLRELLPPEAFTPLVDPSLPDPIDDVPTASTMPFLRVIDNDDGDEPLAG